MRLMREHNDRVWLAWHIAALPMAKNFPSIDKLQMKSPKGQRPQTTEEMLAVARMLASIRFPDAPMTQRGPNGR
jgi:hypothetical protein